jgi:hypothetical protein
MRHAQESGAGIGTLRESLPEPSKRSNVDNRVKWHSDSREYRESLEYRPSRAYTQK